MGLKKDELDEKDKSDEMNVRVSKRHHAALLITKRLTGITLVRLAEMAVEGLIQGLARKHPSLRQELNKLKRPPRKGNGEG